MKRTLQKLLLPLVLILTIAIAGIRSTQARVADKQYCATMTAGQYGSIKVKFVRTPAGQNIIVSASDMQDNPFTNVFGTLSGVDPAITPVFWGGISYTENGVSKGGAGPLSSYSCIH